MVTQLKDIVEIPGGLPAPVLPLWREIPFLLIPAASLAFVGLVQGAGITANFPNPDGTYPKASRDFIGQGVGNLVSGTFQGMPVGGSMSATSIVTTAGAQSRVAQMIAGVVMAVVVIAFGGLVGEIAMPALAGLLMVVGFRTVKPDDIVFRIDGVAVRDDPHFEKLWANRPKDRPFGLVVVRRSGEHENYAVATIRSRAPPTAATSMWPASPVTRGMTRSAVSFSCSREASPSVPAPW